MASLLINSIYRATEGEGLFVGTPQVFIRLQGCAIGCLNCDSVDTWSFDAASGRTLSIENIVVEALSLAGKQKRISITGGDPLHPKYQAGVELLAQELKKAGAYVSLEAAGTRVVHSIFDVIDFINFDLKTPSTQVRTDGKLLKIMEEQYHAKSQVKAVVEDRRDFDFVVKNFEEFRIKIPWFITPAYNLNEPFPLERVQKIIQWTEESGLALRVILQQHKIIHGPNKKNV